MGRRFADIRLPFAQDILQNVKNAHTYTHRMKLINERKTGRKDTPYKTGGDFSP